MRHILKCPNCLIYTMKEACPKCGAKTVPPKPAKYSPEDKYADYRRRAKEKGLKEKGLL